MLSPVLLLRLTRCTLGKIDKWHAVYSGTYFPHPDPTYLPLLASPVWIFGLLQLWDLPGITGVHLAILFHCGLVQPEHIPTKHIQ